MNKKGFTEFLIVVVMLVVTGLIIWGVASAVSNTDYTSTTQSEPAQTAPAEKPFTKTRCDITGWSAPSIIEEEGHNGYQFTGRVQTFLCGENGLSFQRKDVN